MSPTALRRAILKPPFACPSIASSPSRDLARSSPERLISGTVRKEEEVEVLPGARRLRVRGIQNHNQAAERAIAGQRTALNLAAVSPEELARGMMLAPAGLFRAGKRLDVEINLLRFGASAERPRPRSPARLHRRNHRRSRAHRSEATPAWRNRSGSTATRRTGSAAFPLTASSCGSFRPSSLSPEAPCSTPPRRRAASAPLITPASCAGCKALRSEELLAARIGRRQARGLSLSDSVAETGWLATQLAPMVAALAKSKQIVQIGELLVASDHFQDARAGLLNRLTSFHDKNRLVVGMNRQELRDQLGLEPSVFAGVVESLVRERRIELQEELIRIPGRGVSMQSDEAESKKRIEEAFLKAGLQVPALKDVLASLKLDRTRAQQIVTLLLRDRTLIKVNEELVFHHRALADLKAKLLEMRNSSPKIDISRFKDMTGVTRKYAIPLLEYFDREHVTRRVGNERIIQL